MRFLLDESFPGNDGIGFGIAVSVAPLTTTVMDSVQARLAGTASGINNCGVEIVGMIAIAALGRLLSSCSGRRSTRLGEMHVAPAVRHVGTQTTRLAAVKLPPQVDEAAREALRHAIDQSFAASFQVVMFTAAGLALLNALCAAWTIADGKRGD